MLRFDVVAEIVRGVAGLFGRYVPTVPPLEFDALANARWLEIIEAATVTRPTDRERVA